MPGEGEQLPNQSRAPVRRGIDGRKLTPARCGVRRAGSGCAGADDNAEQIVEIMRHAPGHPAQQGQPFLTELGRFGTQAQQQRCLFQRLQNRLDHPRRRQRGREGEWQPPATLGDCSHKARLFGKGEPGSCIIAWTGGQGRAQ
ncbi:MAG: hypothetical protein EBY30_00400 [Rhodospirillales bacterium]|nr:hypothetical protein [Rhodospirillales bacterium]